MKRMYKFCTAKNSKWEYTREKMLIPTIIYYEKTIGFTTLRRFKFIWWHFFWTVNIFFKEAERD